MTYRIQFTLQASKDIRALDPQVRRRVMSKIGELANDLHGDVRRLTNFVPSYRLRAGDWRVLFEVTNDFIDVYRVVHRSKAYD